MNKTNHSLFHDLFTDDDGKQRYWINNNAVDSVPQSETTTDGSLNRSTYNWTRFYGFVTDSQGAVFIISDGTLRLKLKPETGAKDLFRLFDPNTEDSAAGKVSIERGELMLPIFLKVSDTDLASELPPGKYVPMTKEPEPPKTDPKQEWANTFTGRAPSFDRVLTPYDLTAISFNNLQDSKTSHLLFNEPSDESKAYRLSSAGSGGSYPIPYGWRYFSIADSISKSQSSFLSSGKDVMKSYSKTVGVKAGINIMGFKIGASAGHTNSQMFDDMYNQELTYSETTYLDLSFALVVDKANLVLRDYLRQSIFQLQEDRNFDQFLSNFGTHYPYATTFGKRGYQRNSMTKTDVLNVHEANVDAKEALEIGMTMEVDGISGGGDLGMSNENARGLVEKLSSTVGSDISEIHKVGYEDGAWPVLLDLRPISDLLGPPFYDNCEIAVELRDELAKRIDEYCFKKDALMNNPGTQFLLIGPPEKYSVTYIHDQAPANVIDYKIDSVTVNGADGRLLNFVLNGSQPPRAQLDTAAGDVPLTATIKARDKTGKLFDATVKLERNDDNLTVNTNVDVKLTKGGAYIERFVVEMSLPTKLLSGAEVLNGENL